MTRSALCSAGSSTPRIIASELAELRHHHYSCAPSASQNHHLPPPKCVNNVHQRVTFPIVRGEAPPNCCKRLTKRRLFARRPVGRLEQSAFGGRRAFCEAIL